MFGHRSKMLQGLCKTLGHTNSFDFALRHAIEMLSLHSDNSRVQARVKISGSGTFRDLCPWQKRWIRFLKNWNFCIDIGFWWLLHIIAGLWLRPLAKCGDLVQAQTGRATLEASFHTYCAHTHWVCRMPIYDYTYSYIYIHIHIHIHIHLHIHIHIHIYRDRYIVRCKCTQTYIIYMYMHTHTWWFNISHLLYTCISLRARAVLHQCLTWFDVKVWIICMILWHPCSEKCRWCLKSEWVLEWFLPKARSCDSCDKSQCALGERLFKTYYLNWHFTMRYVEFQLSCNLHAIMQFIYCIVPGIPGASCTSYSRSGSGMTLHVNARHVVLSACITSSGISFAACPAHWIQNERHMWKTCMQTNANNVVYITYIFDYRNNYSK